MRPVRARRRVSALGLIALLAGLFLLAWLPRGLELDRVVTPDEPIWLSRSANFYKALADGDFDRTYQFVHPGVTTMWAGTLGYLWAARDYAEFGPAGIATRNNEISMVLREQGIDPLRVLAAGRFVAALLVVIVITLTGWFAVRLLGLGPGLLAGAMLATDPFHVALSRLLHVDGLASSLIGLAAVAWLAYLLDGRRRRDLVIAGIAAGLALLTRSTAAVLAPVVLVSAAIEGGPRYPTTLRRRLWRRVRPVLTFGLIALATAFIGWPAMWTSPIETASRFVTGSLRLGETAHEQPVFFNGVVYDEVDPGVLFYPVSFLWRSSPAVLVGLLFALVAAGAALVGWRRRGRRLDMAGRTAAYLSLLAFTGLLLLTAGEKKLDRYIILVAPPAALIAAWGYGRSAALVERRVRRWGIRDVPRAVLAAPVVLLLLVNVMSLASTRPYELSYYNPMLGGADDAQAVMMLGWGEGMDQVAAALEQLPGIEERQILTSVWSTTLTYFLADIPIRSVKLNAPNALHAWLEADYYLWYVTAAQRGFIPPEMLGYFDELTPVTTVQVNGVTYAKLYDIRSAPIPQALTGQAILEELPNGMQVVSATLPDEPVRAGGQMTVQLYLAGPPPGERLPMKLVLIGFDGKQRIVSVQAVRGPDEARTAWTISRRVIVPRATPSGPYRVLARFGSPEEPISISLGTILVRSSGGLRPG